MMIKLQNLEKENEQKSRSLEAANNHIASVGNIMTELQIVKDTLIFEATEIGKLLVRKSLDLESAKNQIELLKKESLKKSESCERAISQMDTLRKEYEQNFSKMREEKLMFEARVKNILYNSMIKS